MRHTGGGRGLPFCPCVRGRRLRVRGTQAGGRMLLEGSFVRLRTHEFLSRRGKEPKAAGGRRGFHAARRPPDPPLTKSCVSVEPRRGAPNGVPYGSARTAPLKTCRFRRGPVLRGGEVAAGEGTRLCAWYSFGGAGTKKPPLKGEVPAKRAEGFRPGRSRRLCQPP